MGGTELNYIHEAFSTNWIAPLGANVDGFEKDLEQFTGSANAAALSSGTAALHLALILLGVGYQDEVICSSFTFSASANPIVYQGAIPVFVDSEEETWNMDPAMLKAAIEDGLKRGKKPKAVIIVHLYGQSAKMDQLMDICRSYDIPVIEDAAEALGSTFEGKALGTFGELGVLSFNGNKIITTSGGGALISDNEDHIKKARFLSTQARDQAPHYQHSHIGYNYRMSNICAGIGRGQMEVLSERVAARRKNCDYYREKLSDLKGLTFHEEIPGTFSNRWLTCIQINPELSGGITRETVRLHLEKDNIESRPLWKPMHLQPIFEKYRYFGTGVSDRLFDNGLCIPSGSNLTVADLDRVISHIRSLWNV